jgi:tetratricopeptide (TPR) repeat protein
MLYTRNNPYRFAVLFLAFVLLGFTFDASAKEATQAKAYYHYMLGSLKEVSRDYSAAIDEYRKALKYDPEASEIFSRLAYLYVQTNRMDEAIKDVQKAIEMNADNKEAHRMLGQIYMEKIYQNEAGEDDLSKALKEFREVYRIDSNDESVTLTLGQLYLQSKQPEAAAEMLTKYLQKNPDSPAAVMSLANAYQQLSQPEKALQYMQQYLEIRPDNLYVVQQAAELYEKIGDENRALELQKKVYEADPGNPGVTQKYIALLEKKGNFPEAIQILEERIKTDRNKSEWSALLAKTLQKSGEQEKAEALMREVIAGEPDNFDYQFGLVQILEEGNKLGEAGQQLNQMLKKLESTDTVDEREGRTTRALLYSNLGYVAQQSKDYAKAIEYYTNARQYVDADDTGKIDFYIALNYRNQKNYDRAIDVLNDVVRANANDTDAWELLSLVYEEKGDPGNSDKIIKHLIETHPGSPTYPLLQAERLQQREKYAESIQYLKGLESEFPRSDQLYFLLGSASERLKKYDEADDYFRKCIALNAQNANALNYLGYMYIDRGMRLKESIEYVKKALEIDADNGAYLDSLGWAYFKLNQLELAEDNLRLALNKLADNAVVHDHIGDLYFKLGKFQDAIQHWESALQNKNNEIDPDYIQKKINDTKARLR